MIGRIIYGETCKGTLNYVFAKTGMRILCYGNVFSQEISQKFFGNVLHFQGQRNATKNRYAHISLNLPHGEHLNDRTFLKVSREYMEKMGYRDRPYVVVRHTDTKHEHVHIVTTNVKEDGKVMALYNSHKRNMATQRYLEKKFGLIKSPNKKQENPLPVYRKPEPKEETENSQGTRFYIQDILNTVMQKYKVRSFGELARLVKPYHIELRLTRSETGRVGVKYGLNNKEGYRTRFLSGSTVHRSLSGPKLQKVFDIHSKSKLLPMHRKRLLKQIETTYGLFKIISPLHLPEILKEYQDINIKLEKKEEVIEGFTVYDKSGYVFRESELGKPIKIQERPDIFGNGNRPTEMNTESEQFGLEVQKMIKEALITSYLKSPERNGLLSEHIRKRNFTDIVPSLLASKRYNFLERYIPRNQRAEFRKALENAFPVVRERFYELETKKEKEILENKFELIVKILEKGMFDVGMEKGSVRLLFQALGVRYHDNQLSFTEADKHTVPVKLGKLPFPDAMENYVSRGFVRQNHLVLEMLSDQSFEDGTKLEASAFFLPMIFPKLYEKMDSVYKKQYERIALGSFVKHTERMHAPFERSAKDYIALLNAKGFYFEKGENGLRVKSIYTDNGTSFGLPNRTFLYLNSVPDLDRKLEQQKKAINGLVRNGRNSLKNLWAGHLIEKGLYERAAFMLTNENIYPNLHPDMVRHHMDNGLRKTVKEAMEGKSTTEQNRLLRKGV